MRGRIIYTIVIPTLILSLTSCAQYRGFEALLGLFLFGGPPQTTEENGIVLHQSGGTTEIIEGGSTDTIAYTLSRKPEQSVFLTVTNPSANFLMNGFATPQVLEFDGNCPSPRCYQSPQTLTLAAVDDAVDNGTQTIGVTAVAASSDPYYSGKAGPTADVRLADNDGPIAIVLGTTSLTLSEGGSSGSSAVSLSRNPGATVTVSVAFPTGQVRVNGSAVSPVDLTFTAANWNSPQTLTITGYDDAVAEGVHTPAVSLSSPDFADTKSISLTINDNDSAGATVSLPGGGMTATEGGAGSSYTIKLNSEPTANTTVSLAFGSNIQINGGNSPVALTFTPGNWNTTQTVTVTAKDDTLLEGAHSDTIVHSFSGGGYGTVTVSDVTVTLTDNETAGIAITEGGGNTGVTEGGATDSYTIKLTSIPSGTVTISIAFDPAQVSLNGPAGASTATSPYTFTIASADWNTAQTVTVTAKDDTLAEGAHSATMVHTASGGGFGTASSVNVVAAITDNDNPGLTIVQSAGSTGVTEGSSTSDSYTIKLSGPPSADVDVAIAFNNTQLSINGSTTSPQTLTFTTANWNTAQTVTVLALADMVAQGAHNSTIQHSVSSTGDAIYNALGHVSSADITVAITDNPQNAWWNNDYGYRRKILFSCTHGAFTTNHTASITIPTNLATRFDTTGKDLRIVWQPSAGTIAELDRIGYDWNTASTRIDFRLRSAIAANVCPEATDGSYYVYYRNTSAGSAPEAEGNVYFFADFFNRADNTTVGGSWTEWLQNNIGTVNADAFISNGWLALKGGDNGAFLGANNAHWMETGVSTPLTLGTLNESFRTEFDWYVPERVDKYANPNNGSGWSRDVHWHIGFSIGDFSTGAHQTVIGGRTGDTDSWVGVNLLLGEGETSTPDYLFPGMGCPIGSATLACEYFSMRSRLNQADMTNVINNAPGFTNSNGPGNWDSSFGQSTTLKVQIDAAPASNTYDLWLNGVQRMTAVPFIVPNVPLTHVRIFESHYADFLNGSLAFDATPPMKFDNLRIFYPAAASIDSEQPKPP